MWDRVTHARDHVNISKLSFVTVMLCKWIAYDSWQTDRKLFNGGIAFSVQGMLWGQTDPFLDLVWKNKKFSGE